ncbi:hypothetical protein GQ607_002432 [Colletotrichum asianum]|uniref:DUF427 domain-containing protein n=1 Tax=Colletotrichum asianum TaxID=702518 RepID=A0A8H3WM42_9PEZI|nr:hypothetical protein GQ607_002432 [Colletotrichum asianum]
MAAKQNMNVQSFPRPPLLEKVSKHLRITWQGEMIADTKDAYWVLETHHPPTYYLPSTSINVPLTPTQRSTYCEWKGAATYYAITAPRTSDARESQVVSNRIWSYDSPTPGFEAIKGYLSFYAGPWDCFVDGELVEPQPGDFYGGWVTSDIEGIVKGAHGNWDPVL